MHGMAEKQIRGAVKVRMQEGGLGTRLVLSWCFALVQIVLHRALRDPLYPFSVSMDGLQLVESMACMGLIGGGGLLEVGGRVGRGFRTRYVHTPHMQVPLLLTAGGRRSSCGRVGYCVGGVVEDS